MVFRLQVGEYSIICIQEDIMRKAQEIDQNLDKIFKELDGMYKDIVRLLGMSSLKEVSDAIKAIQELRNRMHEVYPDLPKKD